MYQNQIKKYRKQKGLTLAQLAEKVDSSIGYIPFRKRNKKESIDRAYGQNFKSIRWKYTWSFFSWRMILVLN